MMSIKRWLCLLRDYISEDMQVNQVLSQEGFAEDVLSSRIIRYVHSIEKGLSIATPKYGFGYQKINTLLNYLEEYLLKNPSNYICVNMAIGALDEYYVFHETVNYETKQFLDQKKKYFKLRNSIRQYLVEEKCGGTIVIDREDNVFDESEIETLFYSRHSIREFSGEPVEMTKIKKAVKLAQMAPSACNRQAVRVYAIDSKKYIMEMNTSLEGIGGFCDDVDKFLLITGKLSAYEEYEYKQFVVSASIFTGYLSLALHSLGIAACVIQRSLRPENNWKEFCQINNIPGDEQIVCMVAIGMPKKKTRVPFSKRLPLEQVFRTL